MASVFERLSTETQGRLAPAFAPPLLESYAFVLGSDRPGDVARLRIGAEQVVLAQTADVTGLKLLRFRAYARGPARMPETGFDLDHVGAFPDVAVAPRWLFQWGVGGAIHGTRTLLPGRSLVIHDGAIDVSQLTGSQTVRFYLKLSA